LRPIQIIGLASYSIYLSHLIVIETMSHSPLHSLPPPVRIVALGLVGIVPGIAAYYAIEIPSLRFKDRIAHAKASLEARDA
jgi:peptidoglycan/LPS O-acetylase OafA/YrhL